MTTEIGCSPNRLVNEVAGRIVTNAEDECTSGGLCTSEVGTLAINDDITTV